MIKEQKPKPDVVYKYINHFGVNVIKEARIKLTTGEEFNDAFELLPDIQPPTLEEADRKVDDNGTIDFIVQTLPHFRNLPRKYQALEIQKIFSEKTLKPEILRNTFNEWYGISCFTTKPDNVLMWAHYANNHRGMVIGFENKPNSTFGVLLKEVKYKTERVRHTFATHIDDVYPKILEIINRKSIEWKYEDEWRLLAVIKDGYHEKLGKVIKERDKIFFSIHAFDINKIIFGCKADDNLIIMTYEALKVHGLKPEIFRAEIHPSKFKLNLKRIK